MRLLPGFSLAATCLLGMVPAARAQYTSAPLPPGYVYVQPTRYAGPASTWTQPRVVDRRGVLPGFARSGGIGTTPFLGNTQGLGAYSTNFSAPARRTYRRVR